MTAVWSEREKHYSVNDRSRNCGAGVTEWNELDHMAIRDWVGVGGGPNSPCNVIGGASAVSEATLSS